MRTVTVAIAALTAALAAAACSSSKSGSGGGPVKLCAASNTAALSADASGVYWAQIPATGSSSGGAILHLALPAGTPQVLDGSITPLGGPYQGPVLGQALLAVAALDAAGTGDLLQSLPLAGGAPLSLAGQALGAAGPITADATFAYQLVYSIVNTGGIAVIRAPLDGSAPAAQLSTSAAFQVDASGTLSQGVAVDGAFVYWLANVSDFNATLYRAPLTGGSSQILAQNLLGAEGLVLDSANLYTAGSGLTQIPKSGAPVAILASSLSGFVTYPLAIDGQSLYFTFQPEPTAQNIQQLDLATGASTTLYSESCLQAPCFTGMAAIGGTVYWADNTGIFELK